MKFIDEFRDKAAVLALSEQIKKESRHPIRIMEVCGGHTMAIQRFGIPSLLPETVELISGPGCPVCVTSRAFIDKAIAYSRLPNVIITTYGDLIRVPGSTSTLDKEKAEGADIRIVYSILDALEIAKHNRRKKIIFLGIGFETTSPATAAGILKAEMAGLFNFSVYSAHKVMPPAMAALIDAGVNIQGYLGPGHVSTITGSKIYDFIAQDYGLGVVISGFEPTDILQSVLMLVRQFENRKPAVEIQYSRAVKPLGNPKALAMLEEVFYLADDWWRGLGVLNASGMKIKSKFAAFDAEKQLEVEVEPTREDKGCICGSVLKGVAKPSDCKLFGKACTPSDPVGSCMVSNEGACAAYYRFVR
ncbi:MAG: hydrogenase formation protein HypD [Bacteroidetes bacterium]|nr:hydrogenase formation protein HypD [Bacteroidota bacterium]MBU1580091.1 hydrogenase formation protein HypD [Bacteroidota bacterium]MBU2465019.1 hydrogenase formation protein HypD [Bacteroidota bacterium]MBU2556657.1 hydrogenase formation protein HypD [Bacteroidota bacterium]